MSKILINGGTRGLGAGICHAFLEKGNDIIFTGKNKNNVEKASESFSKTFNNRTIIGFQCNSANEAEIKDVIQNCKTKLGGIDVLINNAAVRKYGNISELSNNDWIEAINTNVNGYYYFVKNSLPLLENSNNPMIFNIGSTSATHAFAGGISYCSTKALNHAFSASLDLELRNKGIRICNVELGNINNKGTNETWMLDPKNVGLIIELLTHIDISSTVSSICVKPTFYPDNPEKGIRSLRFI